MVRNVGLSSTTLGTSMGRMMRKNKTFFAAKSFCTNRYAT